MSFSFEVDPDLDRESGMHEEEIHEGNLFSEFEVAFEDFDFESLGVNPQKPTEAKPGSEEKVMMLAARYAAGLPLWHNKDCYDHGPGEKASKGQAN